MRRSERSIITIYYNRKQIGILSDDEFSKTNKLLRIIRKGGKQETIDQHIYSKECADNFVKFLKGEILKEEDISKELIYIFLDYGCPSAIEFILNSNYNFTLETLITILAQIIGSPEISIASFQPQITKYFIPRNYEYIINSLELEILVQINRRAQIPISKRLDMAKFSFRKYGPAAGLMLDGITSDMIMNDKSFTPENLEGIENLIGGPEILAFYHQIQKKNHEIQILEREKRQLSAEIERLQAENTSLQDEVEQIRAEDARISTRNADLESRIDAISMEIGPMAVERIFNRL